MSLWAVPVFVSVIKQECKSSPSLLPFLSCFTTKASFSLFTLLVSAQWKRLPIGNEPPPARAYHSMTSMGARYLLFGGFDGKSTFEDIWWLVPEGIDVFIVVLFIKTV